MNVYRRTAFSALFCLVLGLSVAACGKKSPVVSPPPPVPPTVPTVAPPPPAPPPPAQAPAPPRALTEDDLFAQKSLAQLNAEKPLGDVFFDLDASTIKDESRAALTTDATWLKRWTSVKITIEGHCDERGSAEYNLALGERRATAVKDYLVSLGVSPANIVTVSKGKEAPFCSESNESCWQQNRRGHFVITAK
jgi:peptidoglycan-associated lipoprotein